jgi:1-aminocyclopropane-1-carboxylate deaminase
MEILNHLNIPSPITKVKTAWSESAGIELHIKRDDLIHPIISGNKWRKLLTI